MRPEHSHPPHIRSALFIDFDNSADDFTFDGGSVHGVDVFRVREGKVAEKFAYVKG